MSHENVLGAPAVADLLGVTVQRIYQLRVTGALEAVPRARGSRPGWLFTRASVEALLAKRAALLGELAARERDAVAAEARTRAGRALRAAARRMANRANHSLANQRLAKLIHR